MNQGMMLSTASRNKILTAFLAKCPFARKKIAQSPFQDKLLSFNVLFFLEHITSTQQMAFLTTENAF
jgi:hypothetical protein